MPRSGRSHPMQALIERIRSIFLEMGFSELVDDYVQTAGWNMDALFIPQDHPAREMQDTFYLDNPRQIKLDPKLLKDWKAIHEHGGDTESTGWEETSTLKSPKKDCCALIQLSIQFNILQKIPKMLVEFSPLIEFSEKRVLTKLTFRIPSNRRNNHGTWSQSRNAGFNPQNVLRKDGIS